MKKTDKIIKFLKQYSIEVILFCSITILFIFQGINVWAETIIEYLPYATTDLKMNSFAGYITLFPYFIAKIYYHLPIHSFISWSAFASLVSYIYILLCLYALVSVLNKKINRKSQLLFFIPILALLSHPSVSSLINITHFGYIPFIVYIIFHIFDKNFEEEICDVPFICFVPLLISIISKPSLSFLPFIFVLLFTKLYKNKVKFGIVLLSVILSTYQTFLYAGTDSNLVVKSIFGLFKFLIVVIQNIGTTIIFSITYYINDWSNLKILVLSILSIIFGLLIIMYIIYSLIKNNELNKINLKNTIFLIKRLIIIGLLFFVSVFPYSAVNCELKIFDTLKLGLVASFFKYKLQYQLTSTIVGISLLVLFVDTINKKKGHNILYASLLILFINGLFSGIYSGNLLNVKFIKNDVLKYNDNDVFLYAPYGEWNYALIDSNSGWTKGNSIYKYLDKPSKMGGEYRNKNLEFINQLPKEYKNAYIYLVYSDNSIKFNGETHYLDYFIIDNNIKKISINTDENNVYEFSKSTAYSTRYSIIKYDYDFAVKLYNNDFTMFDSGKMISQDNLNIIIVWE